MECRRKGLWRGPTPTVIRTRTPLQAQTLETSTTPQHRYRRQDMYSEGDGKGNNLSGSSFSRPELRPPLGPPSCEPHRMDTHRCYKGRSTPGARLCTRPAHVAVNKVARAKDC